MPWCLRGALQLVPKGGAARVCWCSAVMKWTNYETVNPNVGTVLSLEIMDGVTSVLGPEATNPARRHTTILLKKRGTKL